MVGMFGIKRDGAHFMDIQDIRDGMIHLRGKRYRSVVTADPLNFLLLSGEEQESVEASFGSLMMSLSFPVQILINTRPVDMRDTVRELRKNLDALPGSLAEYEADLERFLSYFAGQIMITEAYVVVPYDDKGDDYGKARGELMRRAGAVADGLSKCGVNARMLDTRELVRFLFAFFDKDTSVRAEDLIREGALELCKVGRDEDEIAEEKKEVR
ncbi:MAG: hypothetical protein HPY66_0999 [Firmicutes bacterium]|nr:hypothetical protein [Bacillota bacterium]